MLGETGKIIISGLTFEKIDGKRIIQSVFLLDIEDGSCIEVPVASDVDTDKKKLAKELLNYFRKDAVVLIDIQNDLSRLNSNYVNLRFMGIKNN